MLVLEAKIYGKQGQYDAMDEAIRTGQFIRSAIRSLQTYYVGGLMALGNEHKTSPKR